MPNTDNVNFYFKTIKLLFEQFASTSMATVVLVQPEFKLRIAWNTLYIDYLLLPINSCVLDFAPTNEVLYVFRSAIIFSYFIFKTPDSSL